MHIKAILLVAAGLLATASYAQAEDAIVSVEPEPLEYVRVCDGYGKGYFFLPGTETCIRIGGKVRVEDSAHNAYNPSNTEGTISHTRMEIAVDTGQDTEFGALTTDMVLRSEVYDGAPAVNKLLWANISLAGFLIGKQDSQYNLFTNYAGNVVNDDAIYDGPKELNQLTYVYKSEEGLSALISLEDSYSTSNTSSFGGAWVTAKADHYLPNVVGGVGYKVGETSFKVVGGYDSVVEEGAIKARFDMKLSTFSFFLMGGWNTDGDRMNRYAGTFLNKSACPVDRGELCGWGDWALWGGGTVPINDKLSANMQLALTDSKIFEATANVQVKIKDLVVTPEVTYMNFDSIDKDNWSGIVRFERRF